MTINPGFSLARPPGCPKEWDHLRELCRVNYATPPFSDRHLMVVVAHPDDEVLFAGAQLPKAGRLTIVHVTDGAPSAKIAQQRGFSTRYAYSIARRQEFRAALQAGGIHARCECFNYQDGMSCLWIVSGVRRLSSLIDSIRPDLVLTHAYDGGHRDHDTAAALTHLAIAQSSHSPDLWEMACYYCEGGRMHKYRLAHSEKWPSTVLTLAPQDQENKRIMLDRFVSQGNLTEQFPLEVEVFRQAPSYDFKVAPVAGRLAYEANGSGIESGLWRQIVYSSQQILHGRRQAHFRLFFSRVAMYLMLVSFRTRMRYPRVVRPFESLCSTMLTCPNPSDHD